MPEQPASSLKTAACRLAAGLMCLSSFIAPAPSASAADNLTITGAGGGDNNGSSRAGGRGAVFELGGTSYQAQGGFGQNDRNDDDPPIALDSNGGGTAGVNGYFAGGKGHGITTDGWNISLGGGGGGGNFALGNGGAGGATVITGGDVLADNVTVRAGIRGVSTDQRQRGGNGGDVSLTLKSLGFSGGLSMARDEPSRYFAPDGNLTVAIGRLTLTGDAAQTLYFAKRSGSLSVRAGILDMSANGGMLQFEQGGKPNPGDVRFGEIILGGGQTLGVNYECSTLINNTADLFTFNALTILGPGALYDGIQTIEPLTLDAAGKTLRFYAGAASGSTMLTSVNGGVDVTGATVNIFTPGGTPFLQPGYSLTLIDGIIGSTGQTSTTSTQGISLAYDFRLSEIDGKLNALLLGIRANPQASSLFQGRIAGMALLNNGLDFLYGYGISAARDAVGFSSDSAQASLTEYAPTVRVGTFAAASGGWLRYNAGGHTNTDEVSFLTGISAGLYNLASGRALIGAFFEAGYGAFNGDTDDGISTDGYNRSFGGGLLARYETGGGLYAEASGRIGRITTSHDSDFISNYGGSAQYRTTTGYYGAHAGLGYIFRLGQKFAVDASSKYFWTRQDGADTVVLNDPFSFAALNSQRWRTGARMSYECNPSFAPYAGASYEYEFDGKSRGTTYNYALQETSLRGATGGAELGVIFRPRGDRTFYIDVGAQGYLGKRDGVTGTARLGLEF